MSVVKLVAPDKSYNSSEIDAADADRLLYVMRQHKLREGDLLQDGSYLVTIREISPGVWSLHTRKQDQRHSKAG